MTTPTFPRRDLAIGWHALADIANKKAIIIGEVKAKGSYIISGLDIISRPTESELNVALEEYEKHSIKGPKQKTFK